MLVRDASSRCRSIEGGLTMKLAVIEKQNIPAALKKAVVLKRRNRESTMRDTGLLVLRLITGRLIAGHGAQKLFGWFGGSGLKGTAAIFESIGLKPGTPWAIAASASEFGGGVLTALGFLHPLGPMGTMGVMVMATANAPSRVSSKASSGDNCCHKLGLVHPICPATPIEKVPSYIVGAPAKGALLALTCLLPFFCRVRHKNALCLAELIHCPHPEFAMSVAACFHTAERHLYLRTRGRRIEVDQPRLDVAHSTEREACILRENRSREPIFRRVRHLYSLLVRSYRQNRDERAEHLFACNTH